MNISVEKELSEFYKDQYTHLDQQWRQTGAIQKTANIIDICKNRKFKKVLEVGAGDGSIIELLNRKHFAEELYAADISESGIREIKQKKIESLKDVILFDGYTLPYPDQHFDLLILSHVLEHVEHERVLLREIKRVSAMQVIEVPKDYRFGVDKKVNHFINYGHINVYTPSSLKFLLKTEGFEILDELNRLYSKEIYLFNKNKFSQKFPALLTYYFKLCMTSTPLAYINHKFINTITLLTCPNTKSTIE